MEQITLENIIVTGLELSKTQTINDVVKTLKRNILSQRSGSAEDTEVLLQIAQLTVPQTIRVVRNRLSREVMQSQPTNIFELLCRCCRRPSAGKVHHDV